MTGGARRRQAPDRVVFFHTEVRAGVRGPGTRRPSRRRTRSTPPSRPGRSIVALAPTSRRTSSVTRSRMPPTSSRRRRPTSRRPSGRRPRRGDAGRMSSSSVADRRFGRRPSADPLGRAPGRHARREGDGAGPAPDSAQQRRRARRALLRARVGQGRTLPREGVSRLRGYCHERGLPYEEFGKLVIALDEVEEGAAARHRGARAAQRRARPTVARADALREVEPHAAGTGRCTPPRRRSPTSRVAAAIAGDARDRRRPGSSPGFEVARDRAGGGVASRWGPPTDAASSPTGSCSAGPARPPSRGARR